MAFLSVFLKQRSLCICDKFAILPYGQYINGIVIKCGLKCTFYELEVGIYEKFAKM